MYIFYFQTSPQQLLIIELSTAEVKAAGAGTSLLDVPEFLSQDVFSPHQSKPWTLASTV